MKAWVIVMEEIIINDKKKYNVQIVFNNNGDSLFEIIMNAIENEQLKKKVEEDEHKRSIT